jgi:ribonuclease HI
MCNTKLSYILTIWTDSEYAINSIKNFKHKLEKKKNNMQYKDIIIRISNTIEERNNNNI